MELMRKNLGAGLIALMVISAATTAFATTPIRRPSGNGEDGNVFQWMLLGRTAKVNLKKNGVTVTMTEEVVCPEQDVEETVSEPQPALAGSCDSGQYLFIFQFQSTATNVTLKFKELPNFTPDAEAANYGAMVCDTGVSVNTLELCTTDPNGTLLPNMTFTDIGPHAISFGVPDFPNFPAGIGAQGRGLTLFILTQQDSTLPIHFPEAEIE
jgi:hypothetical protein